VWKPIMGESPALQGGRSLHVFLRFLITLLLCRLARGLNREGIDGGVGAAMFRLPNSVSREKTQHGYGKEF